MKEKKKKNFAAVQWTWAVRYQNAFVSRQKKNGDFIDPEYIDR